MHGLTTPVSPAADPPTAKPPAANLSAGNVAAPDHPASNAPVADLPAGNAAPPGQPATNQGVADSAELGKFTDREVTDLTNQLKTELKRAAHLGFINSTWDLIFKVVLLILGVISATDAGLIATVWKTGSPPAWATIANIVVGVLITALAGFATAQVNFSARTEVYRKKEIALQMMMDTLKYVRPQKLVFFRTLQEIYSWNDSTPATVKIPNLLTAGIVEGAAAG
jgi:uncharacterized integral membrane protein